MALTGPSWDEEVVPALRKRLESESRTLARRLSAVSLSSADEALPNQPATNFTETKNMASSISFHQSGAQRLYPVFQPQQHYSDRKIPKSTTPRVNASESSSKPKSERTRTYSSPYASGLSNGRPLPNGNATPKTNPIKSIDPPRSSTSRPPDVKPTRIPKASRGGSFSNGHSPYMNGHGRNTSAVTPPSQSQSPEITNQTIPEQRGPQRVPATSSSRSIDLPRRPSRQGMPLLDESPPFPSTSTMSSFSQHGHDTPQNEDPPRPSIDSEERPYEHWYRGEVSRNGGVGELRVGRRQEMLDIANYGHTIGKKKKTTTTRYVQPITLADEPSRHRKRADSIGGMTDKEREERGSLYLDDEHATEVGRVLDESPLTDLDGEGSDTNSISEYHNGPYAYIPDVEDNLTPMSEPWTPTPGTYEVRSLTPTTIPPSMIPRPSSRQQPQSTLHTRIAAPSSRRSSESVTVSTIPAPMTRGASEPPQLPSSSKTSSPPPTTTSHPRQQTYASNTLPVTSTQKRATSPASKKSRPTVSKTTRGKTSASRKEQDEQLNRKSVGYYPTPAGEGDDMADAIPSWTRPIHREGNWDEVVLPVVARKKGLDEHYESADGSPQPKKLDNMVAPAPGTFGYDHSKYRPPRNDSEPIPMDEFGRPPDQDGSRKLQQPPNEKLPIMPEEPRRPKSMQPLPASSGPFSRYPTPNMQVVAPFADMVPQQQQSPEKKGVDEINSGCCRCIIM